MGKKEEIFEDRILSLEFDNYPIMVGIIKNTITNVVSKLDIETKVKENYIRVTTNILKRRMKEAYCEKGTFYLDLYIEKNELVFSLRDLGSPYFSMGNLILEDGIKEMIQMIKTEEQQIKNNIFAEKLGKDGQRVKFKIKINDSVKVLVPEKKEFEILDTNFSLREVKVDRLVEINEAINCIHNEYKYSYAYEDLYKLNKFKSKIISGEMLSYLVINEHKQVAGHFALFQSDVFKNMPELATVIVRKEFRGMHIGERVFEYGVNEAIRHGKSALCVQPTAYHIGTQKICNRLDFTPTGFLFQYVNEDIQSEYNTKETRLDLALGVKLLKPQSFRIYCPYIIKNLVSTIFNHMKSDVEFLTEKETYEESVMNVAVNDRMKSAKVVVEIAGDNFEERLEEVYRIRKQHKLEMVEAIVSMENFSIHSAFIKLKKAGFIFAGIMPGSDSGVYLIMQHLYERMPRFDEIVTIEPYTSLLKEIREIDEYIEEDF